MAINENRVKGNVAFKEDDYKEIVYVMDGYIARLKSLYASKEKARRDKIVWITTLAIISSISIFSVFELTKLEAKIFPIKGMLTISTILTFIIAAISTLFYLNKASRDTLYSPLNNTREIIYTRTQLLKFVQYISQVLDHNEFSAPKKFLMDLKLSEAEEVINLTEQFFRKHSSKASKPTSSNQNHIPLNEVMVLIDLEEKLDQITTASIQIADNDLLNLYHLWEQLHKLLKDYSKETFNYNKENKERFENIRHKLLSLINKHIDHEIKPSEKKTS